MRLPRSLPLVLVAAMLLGAGGCGDDEPSGAPAPAAAASGAEQTNQYAAPAKRAVGAVPDAGNLLDVRTQEEWDAGHARDAQLLPLARVEAGEIPAGYAKSEPLYVYCRSGRRAAIAVEKLRAAGFTAVTNIGGLDDWVAAGGALAPPGSGQAG